MPSPKPPPVSRDAADDSIRRGLIAAVLAFTIWGGLPLFLRELQGVPASVIMAHRVIWCALVVVGWLALRGELGGVRRALTDARVFRRLSASALLISVNWLLYVWAVGHGHVLDGSLGYFINPLVNVLLGVGLLSERLNPRQWTAVSVAAAGVLWLTVQGGQLPWIALLLAISFGSYGLIRKLTPVDAVSGLAAETLLITPLALAYLVWQQLDGAGALGSATPRQLGWLLAGGPITAIPLALFAYGAQRIAYSSLGLIQYLAPSLQLVLGLSLFGEPFPAARAAGFGLIWLALLLFAGDGLWRARRDRRLAPLRTEDGETATCKG